MSAFAVRSDTCAPSGTSVSLISSLYLLTACVQQANKETFSYVGLSGKRPYLSEYGMRYPECAIRNALSGMRYPECTIRNALSGMRYPECAIRTALSGMRYPERSHTATNDDNAGAISLFLTSASTGTCDSRRASHAGPSGFRCQSSRASAGSWNRCLFKER